MIHVSTCAQGAVDFRLPTAALDQSRRFLGHLGFERDRRRAGGHRQRFGDRQFESPHHFGDQRRRLVAWTRPHFVLLVFLLLQSVALDASAVQFGHFDRRVIGRHVVFGGSHQQLPVLLAQLFQFQRLLRDDAVFSLHRLHDPLLLLPQQRLEVQQLPDDALQLAVFEDAQHLHLALLFGHFGRTSGHQLARASALQSQLLLGGGQSLARLLQLLLQPVHLALHLK